MAGGRANRVPRCPVCAGMLSTDRTIDERWVRRGAARPPDGGARRPSDDPGPDLWIYRLACAQCLSIASVEIPEVSALTRSEPSSPVVDVAGSVVARVLERLRAASGPIELAEIHRATRAEPEHRVLLRIPEVASLVRPAFADGAWLAEDVVIDWPALGDSSRPSGRITLHRPSRVLSEEPVVVVGEALELRLRAGRRLAVLAHEGGTLHLAPPSDEPEISEWLADVERLVAWADFVVASPLQT